VIYLSDRAPDCLYRSSTQLRLFLPLGSFRNVAQELCLHFVTADLSFRYPMPSFLLVYTRSTPQLFITEALFASEIDETGDDRLRDRPGPLPPPLFFMNTVSSPGEGFPLRAFLC